MRTDGVEPPDGGDIDAVGDTARPPFDAAEARPATTEAAMADATREDRDPLPPPDCMHLTAVIRDFDISHPDFEDAISEARGLVEEHLDAERKPVYVPNTLGAITSTYTFRQW